MDKLNYRYIWHIRNRRQIRFLFIQPIFNEKKKWIFSFLFQNKCERYWPLNLDQVEMFGEISVSVTACVDTSAYDLRYIQLKKVGIVYIYW